MCIAIQAAIVVSYRSSLLFNLTDSERRLGESWFLLVIAEVFGETESDLGPYFMIEDQRVVLDPLQITNLPRDILGPPLLSLAGEDGRIINAIDALLSRAWR